MTITVGFVRRFTLDYKMNLALILRSASIFIEVNDNIRPYWTASLVGQLLATALNGYLAPKKVFGIAVFEVKRPKEPLADYLFRPGLKQHFLKEVYDLSIIGVGDIKSIGHVGTFGAK